MKPPIVHQQRRKEATGFQEDRRTPGLPLPTKPWMPAPFDVADIAAMKALRDGVASPEQQTRALAWIIEYAARTYVNPYALGSDGDRDTAYGCGCKHVGEQIVKLLNWRSNFNEEQGR